MGHIPKRVSEAPTRRNWNLESLWYFRIFMHSRWKLKFIQGCYHHRWLQPPLHHSDRENLRKIQGIGANPEPPLLRGLLLLLGLGERLSSVGRTFLHCIFQKVLQGSPNLTSFVYLFTNSAFTFASFQVFTSWQSSSNIWMTLGQSIKFGTQGCKKSEYPNRWCTASSWDFQVQWCRHHLWR